MQLLVFYIILGSKSPVTIKSILISGNSSPVIMMFLNFYSHKTVQQHLKIWLVEGTRCHSSRVAKHNQRHELISFNDCVFKPESGLPQLYKHACWFIEINIQNPTWFWGRLQHRSSEDVKHKEEHGESGSHGVELWRRHVGNVKFLRAVHPAEPHSWRKPSPLPPLNQYAPTGGVTRSKPLLRHCYLRQRIFFPGLLKYSIPASHAELITTLTTATLLQVLYISNNLCMFIVSACL